MVTTAPKAAMIHLVLAVPLLSLILPFSSLALTQDFCVADLQLPDTPSGYPCKPKALVDSDDFYSDALAKPGPVIAPFNTSLVFATVKEFPALNGLGLAGSRADILPSGVMPLHTHPEASELLLVAEGTISTGFISADTNKLYFKTLQTGELFVFPQGLLHFQYNVGNSTAIVYAAYSSPNPGLQIADYARFRNTLPADVVAKLTSIVGAKVDEGLKRLFGVVSVLP